MRGPHRGSVLPCMWWGLGRWRRETPVVKLAAISIQSLQGPVTDPLGDPRSWGVWGVGRLALLESGGCRWAREVRRQGAVPGGPVGGGGEVWPRPLFDGRPLMMLPLSWAGSPGPASHLASEDAVQRAELRAGPAPQPPGGLRAGYGRHPQGLASLCAARAGPGPGAPAVLCQGRCSVPVPTPHQVS